MIACRFERKASIKAGLEPKRCDLCSQNSDSDDEPHDDPLEIAAQQEDSSHRFRYPNHPRRHRAATQGSVSLSALGGNGMSTTTFNPRSFSVEEEPDDMEMDDDTTGQHFQNSRRVSI